MQPAYARYLEKRADLDRWKIQGNYTNHIDTVVVVPCLAERANLPKTLTSIAACDPERLRRTVVLCVVNNRAPEHAVVEDIQDNQALLHDLRALAAGRDAELLPYKNVSALRLAYIDASSPNAELPKKDGVGLARKIGLDWGVRILAEASSSTRLLCSLDADTTVAPNYLNSVRDAFNHERAWAGVVYFEHPLPDAPAQRRAIVGYESFLRCHVHGLRLAGSPYAFHTVGSTMVCTPEAYVAVAGMNRRQAAEDFYFLQQLAKTGELRSIATTTVYPSARPSHRVPFGTGRRVRQTLESADDALSTYAPDSYEVVRACLQLVTLADADTEEVYNYVKNRDDTLSDFLKTQDIDSAWPRMRQSATSDQQRRRQFHTWFDAFRTLKLMHFLRDNGRPNATFPEAARTWAPSAALTHEDPECFLMWLREQDRLAAEDPPRGMK